MLFRSQGQKPEAGALPKNLNPILDFARASPDIIEPAQAQELVQQKGVTFLDVRSLEEFNGGHANGSLNMPIAGIVGGYAAFPDDKTAPIVAICQSGERSLHAMLLFKAMGYTNVKNVKGGIVAWTAAGLL